MAKQIPYKCRFGHITIMKFSNNAETWGTVECEQCKKSGDNTRFSFGNNHRSLIYSWFGKTKDLGEGKIVLAYRY